MSQSLAQSSSPSADEPSEPLDPVALSSLLASRLCHDLVNPVGALGSGVEVLEDESMDEVMKEAALDLIKTGGDKSVALLKYARLAYGAAGGRGAEIPMDEAELIMRELFAFAKAELVWNAPAVHELKEIVKTVMILSHYAADCVPRGGSVTVAKTEDGAFTVTAEGPRLLLQEDLLTAFAGVCEDLKPKYAPAYVAYLLATELGGGVEGGRVGDDKVVFTARFSG